MDRSHRGEREPEAAPVPSASRLTVRKKNRRRPVSLWSRAPRPKQILDGCGRALRRSVPAIVATCAVTVLGCGLWLGYRFVTTSDRFAIEQIEVNGNTRLSADQVRAAMPIQVGDNVFTADLGDVTARLRGEPWIASAEARRVLPDTIVIDIREHQAAAVIALPSATGTERYLADARGRLFKRADAVDGDALPLITGLPRTAYRSDPDGTARQIVAALEVLRMWREADRPAISTLQVDAAGAIALQANQTSIQLGLPDGGVGLRLRTFDAVWAELATAERTRARTIHLDARLDHVTVAFAKKD